VLQPEQAAATQAQRAGARQVRAREASLRILINDYCGHPFQVELSRELARRGHTVLHLYSADDQTPKGDLLRGEQDADGFDVLGISIGEKLQKYNNLARRRRQERAYGRLVCSRIDEWLPDMVVGSNNPLEAQNLIGNHCRRRGLPFVYWLQDVHSEAIRSFLGKRFLPAGTVIGTWYEWMERRALRNAAHVIAIADNFRPQLARWQIDARRVSVIENWAPRDKIRPQDRETAWRREQGLDGQRVVMYTGTIGLKHNPDLLVSLAESLASERDVHIVVISQGKYADYVSEQARARGLSNLRLLPFQPFDRYAEVLASSDVLIAMIEPDAASYSVPSKVLSYLCSGRPIVLSANATNLAARTIRRAHAGVTVDSKNTAHFIGAVKEYLAHLDVRLEAGRRGRAFADREFDIETIADRFQQIFRNVHAQ
jgi:glycosyltransferase involved in cell wall biosynthesis